MVDEVGGTIEQRELPDDIEALKELVRARDAVIAEKDTTIRHLQREFDTLRRMMFGRKSDKRPLPAGASPHPLLFSFVEQAEEVAKAKGAEGVVEITPPKAPGKKGKRPRRWPSDAPTVRTTYELPEEARVCNDCGGALHELGDDVTRELERFVMTVIHEIARKKYACRKCENGVRTAPGPDRIIEKGLLGPTFLSQVIVDRFGNHMPYHRLEKQYASEGLELSRSVLQRSMARLAELLEPISEQIKQDVLASTVIHTDDTPVVIARSTEGGSRKARTWIYLDREGGTGTTSPRPGSGTGRRGSSATSADTCKRTPTADTTNSTHPTARPRSRAGRTCVANSWTPRRRIRRPPRRRST